MTPEDDCHTPTEALRRLQRRIDALLPPRYAGRLEEVAPTSMGSAGLRFDAQGRVAWGEIWTSFCHLALAGGPPHRGRWLAAVSQTEAEASPVEQAKVTAELERAIRLTVDLPVVAERRPGWVGVRCDDGAMASWLQRAITAENIVARRDGDVLLVPAGPRFRIEKEVKNVVVSLAKSCHYLLGHVEDGARTTGEGPNLIEPPLPDEIAAAPSAYAEAAAKLKQAIEAATPLRTVSNTSVGDGAVEEPASGWLGFDCGTEDAAVWLLRAVAVDDVLVRREDSRLYVPVALGPADPTSGSSAIDRTAASVFDAWRLWNLSRGEF